MDGDSPSHENFSRALLLRPHPENATPGQALQSLPANSEPGRLLEESATHVEPMPHLYTETSSSSTSQPLRWTSLDVSDSEELSDDYTLPSCFGYRDCYSLQSGWKNEDEIRETLARIPPGPRHRLRTMHLASFYARQNADIEHFLMPIDDHVRLAREERAMLPVRFARCLNLISTIVVILPLQLWGGAASGHLTLFCVIAEACGAFVVALTHTKGHLSMLRVCVACYPAGKSRVATVANITISFIMLAIMFVFVDLAAWQLVNGYPTPTNSFPYPGIVSLSVAIFPESIQALYGWSWRARGSGCGLEWVHHRNEVVINVVGLASSIGAAKIRWWIDPMGTIVLAAVISAVWMRSAYGEFQLLVGAAVDSSTTRLVTYLAVTHSPLILAVNSVFASFSGPRFIVEVHVVMSPDKTLKETHDVAEELQLKLESLPTVERAFVGVDYVCGGPANHVQTKYLPPHKLRRRAW